MSNLLHQPKFSYSQIRSSNFNNLMTIDSSQACHEIVKKSFQKNVGRFVHPFSQNYWNKIVKNVFKKM